MTATLEFGFRTINILNNMSLVTTRAMLRQPGRRPVRTQRRQIVIVAKRL